MELFEAIKNRHSYRGAFKAQPIPRSDLQKIVEAGLLAPSGTNAQTTRFVIIDDPELLRAIGGMHTMPAMRTAPAMIACIVDVDPQKVYEGFAFAVEDCAAAVENILLALTAMGYYSVWIDGWLRLEQRAEKIGQMLGLPQGKRIRILLPVGVPAETVTAKDKKPFKERAFYNRYCPVNPH